MGAAADAVVCDSPPANVVDGRRFGFVTGPAQSTNYKVQPIWVRETAPAAWRITNSEHVVDTSADLDELMSNCCGSGDSRPKTGLGIEWFVCASGLGACLDCGQEAMPKFGQPTKIDHRLL